MLGAGIDLQLLELGAALAVVGQHALHGFFQHAVGMRLRLIPGGSFLMGSDTGQEDELPVHRVTVSPFYMGVHEVTQEQYSLVTGENPSFASPDGADSPERMKYCGARSP